jgi:carboxyl-terminal processing protease
MAQETAMSSRTRALVLSLTAPVILFVLVGGVLGRAMGREETYQHLKIFDDVVSLISSNYVEPANLDKVMKGAMNGLVDALDADSAFLTPELVKQFESAAPLPPADTGLEITRQYYLRVIAARDNSSAAKAGLRPGDYIRSINDVPTRDMSAWEGTRMLRGAAGSKVRLTVFRNNQADPHDLELIREVPPAGDVTSRIASPGVGYVRVPSIGARTVDQVKAQIATVTKAGAARLIIDVRKTASGSYDQGIALARLFVASGTLAQRDVKGAPAKDMILSNTGDGAISVPLVVLVDSGTAGASELFAAAIAGNKRAELVGEHTIGRAGVQKLIKLPDGSALWLTTARYLTPSGAALHEKGLEPTVGVDLPEVEFGQQAPAGDPALDKALERLVEKKAA